MYLCGNGIYVFSRGSLVGEGDSHVPSGAGTGYNGLCAVALVCAGAGFHILEGITGSPRMP